MLSLSANNQQVCLINDTADFLSGIRTENQFQIAEIEVRTLDIRVIPEGADIVSGGGTIISRIFHHLKVLD